MTVRRRFRAAVTAVTVVLVGGSSLVACSPASPPTPPTSATGCNGADALCDRTYDAVAYVTTHNAMASEAYGFAAPNQSLSFTGQLDAGVRALMLDIHRNGSNALPGPGLPTDTVALCHGFCAFGAVPLVSGLNEIRTWLDAHPREVLTDFDAATTADFTCDVLRGSSGNRLIILNHFLTNPEASPLLADRADGDPFMSNRVGTCRAAWGGRLPNFATVDFFELGVPTAVVRSLNGL